MSIAVKCVCGFTGKVPDSYAGSKARCPECQGAVDVPGSPPDEAEADRADGDVSIRCLRWAASRPTPIRWALIVSAFATLPTAAFLAVRMSDQTTNELLRNVDPEFVLARLDQRVASGDNHDPYRYLLDRADAAFDEDKSVIVGAICRTTESLAKRGKHVIPWLLVRHASIAAEEAGGASITSFLTVYESLRDGNFDHEEACRETGKTLKQVNQRRRSRPGI